MRLEKKDWELLDKLLAKSGFGGYYDLVECLKICINDLNSIYKIFKEEKIKQESDLKILIKMLNKLTNIKLVKIQDLFNFRKLFKNLEEKELIKLLEGKKSLDIIESAKLQDLKQILSSYIGMRDFGNSYSWRFVEKVLFHELYLIGIIDKAILTKEEEYGYFDMGKPKFESLIEERLLNKTFRKIDDDYLEN